MLEICIMFAQSRGSFHFHRLLRHRERNAAYRVSMCVQLRLMQLVVRTSLSNEKQKSENRILLPVAITFRYFTADLIIKKTTTVSEWWVSEKQKCFLNSTANNFGSYWVVKSSSGVTLTAATWASVEAKICPFISSFFLSKSGSMKSTIGFDSIDKFWHLFNSSVSLSINWRCNWLLQARHLSAFADVIYS